VPVSSPARPRQIMNVANSNLSQENIKIILKNDDPFMKQRQKLKKREKKSKKEKISRKEVKEKSQKVSKEQQQKKEVFASGDNILISVCFNNNNNSSTSNNNTTANSTTTISTEHPTKASLKAIAPEVVEERVSSGKSKAKKRPAAPSPARSISSGGESYDKMEKRQRKHKGKKSKRRHVQNKSSPKTPPMNPPSNQSLMAKRKSDMKPIAIIDLEKSPGKEITQSPKEIIVLSDSDGEGKKKRDSGDIVIIEDTVLEKGGSMRNHSSPRDHHHTPTHATPESPPPPPVLKFALKSKSNILPFNLLHDQAEEIEESNGNTNAANDSQQAVNKNSNSLQKEQQDAANNASVDDKSGNNQNEAYDPFEPTKSGSNSPVTPPPPAQSYEPANNEVSKGSKLEALCEKLQNLANKESNQIPGLGSEDHQIQTSSLWNKKSSQQQPLTPPLPPSFITSSSAPVKSHVSLYDGIYGSDLKTPVVPSPNKASKSTTLVEKNNKNSSNNDDDDDDRTPYSPSSDGYDYEPAPSTSLHQNKSNFESLKHSDLDTQSSEPSGSYSFERNEEAASSKIVTTPLKLTASSLKTFNSSMRTSSSGLQFVNKAELSIFENYLPASQQKSPLVKRQSASSFIRAKMSRFTSSMNENGSPHRSAPFSDSILKPPVIGKLYV
jgi:hypothetical protein